MPRRDVVVVGASAGGIDALQHLHAGVPEGFGGVILVVLHIPAEGGRSLARIFGRAGPLPVAPARDGERLRPGHMYVCVADHHLLLGDGVVEVRRAPAENGHRPAVDPLFRSAAHYFGPRVVGVVLSGTLTDGTAGLAAVRRHGGIAVVQDPVDALYDGMPSSALQVVGADHVLPASEIGGLLAQLAGESAPPDPSLPDRQLAVDVSLLEGRYAEGDPPHPGRASPWPCPDCAGVLCEVDDPAIPRFRCRVGHAWTAVALLQHQGAEVEAALGVALRSLEDRAALSRSLGDRAERDGRLMTARRFRSDLDDMTRSIANLRWLVQTDDNAKEAAPG